MKNTEKRVTHFTEQLATCDNVFAVAWDDTEDKAVHAGQLIDLKNTTQAHVVGAVIETLCDAINETCTDKAIKRGLIFASCATMYERLVGEPIGEQTLDLLTMIIKGEVNDDFLSEVIS